MKTRYQFLYLLSWASILWGCTPGAVNTIPIYESTATHTQVMATSPNPSATATQTIVPETETVSPSTTIPGAIATTTPEWSEVPQEICRPGELEQFLADLSPIADQIILLGREARQLEELPIARAEEMLAETEKLEPALNLIHAPTCLDHSYRKAIDALISLESSLNYLLVEDYDKAKTDLQEALITVVQSVVYISAMSWELTATSTPTQ